MRSGADLQDIMMKMYKTVTFDFLKLWGQYLQNLQTTKQELIAWSVLPENFSADIFAFGPVLTRTAQALPNTKALFAFDGKRTDNGIILLNNKRYSHTILNHLPQSEQTHIPHILTFQTDKSPKQLTQAIAESLQHTT